MTENPYRSPHAELPTALALWRRILGVIVRICSIQAGVLAITMCAAGVNWLAIELAEGPGLSLSLALLTGAAVSAAVCAGLAWIAVLVGGRFSWFATLLIIAIPALLDLVSLALLFGSLPRES